MRMGAWLAIGAIVLGGALGACSRAEEPRLRSFAGMTDGPDPFAVVPTRPLEMPADFASLPQPLPGGQNRADPQPRADAIAALGGRPAAEGAVPAVDAALVARASRFGVEPGIRDQLAAEDLRFRRANQGRLLERWFAVDVYARVYRPQALDGHAELERWRRAGVRTPAAPPAQ
ncbi:MAG: DUF3035 domain-containing protein [Alkalilacustris sp.]